ncbi:hypothetical protein IAR55_004212 [Kwoniella newhampshirensis]|uniref:NmrA-like domain-containing protein n=1 Tax=Kwoniella newhampshirensis TaxID=1651941 RepID=A0AAW0YYE4_9TREE
MKVVVFTATGDQGSSVCKYLLEAGHGVFGITRNASSDKAKALAAQGVTLVVGDMSDPSSYADKLKDIDAAFVNADFWSIYNSNGYDALSAQRSETSASIAAIDACVVAGAKHIVYSTLDEVEEGACPHYESKAAVSRYLRENNIPHTNLLTCNYFSNFTKFGLLKRSETDANANGWTVTFPVPDNTLVSSYAVEQTGLWVVEALKKPEQWLGKVMQVCSSCITVTEMAECLSRVSGSQVDRLHLTKEQFYSDAHKAAVGEEFWLACKVLVEGGMQRDVEASKLVVPTQWDLEAWAGQDKDMREWFNL